MVFNATFNNISALAWWSVLLVEEAEYPEKTTDLPQVTDKLNNIKLNRVHIAWAGFEPKYIILIPVLVRHTYPARIPSVSHQIRLHNQTILDKSQFVHQYVFE